MVMVRAVCTINICIIKNTPSATTWMKSTLKSHTRKHNSELEQKSPQEHFQGNIAKKFAYNLLKVAKKIPEFHLRHKYQ